MKKTLALLLAFALVFSSITVAFAEETLPVDAKAVTDLGMLTGAGNGVTLDYLKVNPSRIQAAVMFLRLKGLEETAKAFTGTANFADADQAAWAKPIMAYLLANPSLGFAGIGGDKFDPNGSITAASYYKVMLTALGYTQNSNEVIGDFTFPNVIEFAASKGLVKVATATNYTVSDLATATVEALKATVKGSTKTLAASLVDAKVITEAAAVAAGVYTVAPTVLAVESVKAVNLKETVVTFNKEVDEDTAEDTDNYLLDDEAIVGTVALNADNKSVTITWTTKLDNQTEFDLTVSDVLDAAGVALEEVTVTFLANDVTLPVAQSLTLVGPNKLKLVFSEPIDEALEADYSVTVEDKDFDYEVATIDVDGNEVIIELSDDELTVGDYSVEVSDFKDYAGLKGLKKTFTLAYAKDTTAPVATIKSATQTKVVVEFNKPVYNGEAGNAEQLTADFFYHTYSSYNPVYVVAATDNEEFTLYFTEAAAEAAVTGLNLTDVTDRPLAEGNVKFVVVADGEDTITDEWGNELKDNVSFTVSISADVTAPTVTKVDVDDQNNILVYFNEDVDLSDATFTVVGKDGEDVDVNSVSYDNTNDEYVATLNFTDALEGEYSVTVEDVVDLALEANDLAKVTVKFEVADEAAPLLDPNDTDFGMTFYGIDGTDTDSIYVTFPEDMATSGEYSVLNKDNYQIKVGAAYYDLKSDDKIVTFGGNDKIKITLDDPTYVVEGGVRLVVYRVADALANKSEDFGYSYAVIAEPTPTIDSVEVTGEKTIEITIDAELKSVNKAYITVSHNGDTAKPLYAIKSWNAEDGETVITGILAASQYADTSADTDYVVTVSVGDKFETILGTDMTADIFAGTVDDGYAPSITDDDDIEQTANGEFVIVFDENLATGSIESLYAQDLVVKDSKGNVLVAGVDYTTEVVELASGDTIIVTIEDLTNAEEGNYKVYSASTIKYIQDVAGNKANAFTTSVTLEDLVQ